MSIQTQIKIYTDKYAAVMNLLAELLAKASNLSASLYEYNRRISSDATLIPSTKQTLLSSISINVNLANGLMLQIKASQERLAGMYAKSRIHIAAPETSEAQLIFQQFAKSLNDADAQIADYSIAIAQSQKNIDALGANIRNQLPEGPLMYKVEEAPSTNPFDTNIIIFLMLMVGLAIYYFRSWGGQSPRVYPAPAYPAPAYPAPAYPAPAYPAPAYPAPAYPAPAYPAPAYPAPAYQQI
jgi:hypothetical protein